MTSSRDSFRSAALRPILPMSLALALLSGPALLAQSDNVELGGAQELIVRDSTNLSTEQLGAVQILRSGISIGASLAGEYSNTGDESRTVVYVLGKVAGYWGAQGRNVGIQGHATGEGDDGYGVQGSYGGYVDADQTGIDAPDAWGALGGRVGVNTYAVISNGEQFSTAGTLWTTSDVRLKQDVEDIQGALEVIRHLRPSTFEFRPEVRELGLSVPESSQYGFVAQELEPFLPSLVRDVELPMAADAPTAAWKNDGLEEPEAPTYKAIEVLSLIPLLTKAVQELDSKYEAALAEVVLENNELKLRLAELEGQLERRSPRFASTAMPAARASRVAAAE